ncbi:UNVERIFIED_CONTAM: uncharacterized membrane protein (DUF4010 family) [Brevibacillus sp. OAP136]
MAVFANRETPYVFGMPFNLFWIVLWIVLISLIMFIIAKLDDASKEGDVS